MGAGGDQVQVGIVHNHMEYEPKHPLALSAAWVTPIVRVINQAWVSSEYGCASSNTHLRVMCTIFPSQTSGVS